jgi:hypothetical protein
MQMQMQRRSLECVAGQSFVRSDVCAPWKAAKSASSLRTSRRGTKVARQQSRGREGAQISVGLAESLAAGPGEGRLFTVAGRMRPRGSSLGARKSTRALHRPRRQSSQTAGRLARKDSQRRWKQAQTEHRLVSSTQARSRLGARAALCLSRDLVALSRPSMTS